MNAEITEAVLNRCIAKLGMLKFAPSTPASLQGVAEIMVEKCSSDAELEAVTAGIIEGFDEWPGPRSFRDAVHRTWRGLYGPKSSSDGRDPYMLYVPEWKKAETDGPFAFPARAAA